MSRFITIGLHALTFLLVVAFCPRLAAGEELLVSWEPYPPYEYSEDGVVKGTSTALINEVCKRLNITPVYVEQPFARALLDIQAGNINAVYCLVRKPEREKFLYYPRENIGEAVAGIISRDDSNIEVASFSELKKYSVGVVRGYSYGKGFDSLELNKLVVANNEHLLKLLDNRRVDLVVGNYNVLSYLHQQAGFKWKLNFLYETNRSPYYIAFSKKMGKRGQRLALAFDRELKRIKTQKTVTVVYTSWFPYTYTENGEAKGYEIDILKAVFKRMHVDAKYVERPWKRCLMALEYGEADVLSSMLKNPDRAKYTIFSDTRISCSRVVLFTKKGASIDFDGSFESIKGKTIGYTLGFDYGAEFAQASFLKKDSGVTVENIVKKVIEGRNDIGIENEAVIKASAKKLGVLDQIKIITPAVFTKDLFIGFSKETVSPYFSAEFSAELQRFYRSSDYQKILNRYESGCP